MKIVISITVIKVIHSLIWLVMVMGIMVILISGISGVISFYTYLSLGLLSFELLILVLNKGVCPLTNIARRVKADWQDGDDIYLPKWMAIHNKQIFGTLLVIGLILMLIRLVQ